MSVELIRSQKTQRLGGWGGCAVGQRLLKLQNRILKSVVASFRLDSVLLTEGKYSGSLC